MFGTKKRGFVLICLTFLFYIRICSFPVITEVMSNVKGSDSGAGSPGDRNEFIEIYNNSDSDILITHFSIGDGDAMDNICIWNDSLGTPADNVFYNDSILHPHRFAVILDPEYCSQEYASQPYFMPYVFGDSCLILTVGNTTLGNGLSTSDPVFLYDSNLIIIDTYGTPFDSTDTLPYNPGDGISMEKIYLDGTDGENNWQPSKSAAGCTPGNYNSVSENNLIDILCSWQIDQDSINLDFSVINKYNIDLCNSTITLQMSEFSSNERFAKGDSSILFYGDIIDSPFNISCKRILNLSDINIAKITLKNSNVSSSREFWIKENSDAIPPLEINEVMENGNISPDWIEIHNISQDSLFINDARIDINDNHYPLPDFTIKPNQYTVILYDTGAFYTKYSRNIDVLLLNSSMHINQNDTIKLSVGNTNIENFTTNRTLHFGSDTSIERIKDNIPSSNIDNWTNSRSSKGATPGTRNSVSDTALGTKNQTVIITPNPFKYGRDNIISMKLPDNSYLINTIHVYKTDGFMIADIKINNPYLKEILWKPRTNTGLYFSTGLYIVAFKYEDKNGKRHLVKVPLAIKNR